MYWCHDFHCKIPCTTIYGSCKLPCKFGITLCALVFYLTVSQTCYKSVAVWRQAAESVNLISVQCSLKNMHDASIRTISLQDNIVLRWASAGSTTVSCHMSWYENYLCTLQTFYVVFQGKAQNCSNSSHHFSLWLQLVIVKTQITLIATFYIPHALVL